MSEKTKRGFSGEGFGVLCLCGVLAAVGVLVYSATPEFFGLTKYLHAPVAQFFPLSEKSVAELILGIGAGLPIFFAMFLGIVWLRFYLDPSPQRARTWLYAILFLFLINAPIAAIFRGGWWWLAPPLTLVLIALIMRVDDADARPPGWLHPWG